VCKQAAAGGRHEQDDEHQNGQGRQDQCANSQLGPLNLFTARHSNPLEEVVPTGLPHRLENSRKGRGYRDVGQNDCRENKLTNAEGPG
jgi:hypothetical protein